MVAWVLVLLAAWHLIAAEKAQAGDARLVWKTIETEHFVIHYYEPLGKVARHVAASAERSHALLSPVFGHAPAEKTHIAIVDDTDGANGFASVLPRNRIRLFATVPTAGSALNDHDDWLFVLTAHEYTHVLHLDSIGGLPKLFNKLFGKTWSPNQVQPRWVIEGIATFEESMQTSGGRVRGANFDMNLRAVVLANQRLDLDAVSHGPRAWPRGNAAYLYGSHFLDYVFDRYGHDKLREMSWAYGSNPIPYSLNRTIQQITGRTFADLYDDWLEHLRAKYSMQVEAAERAGLREGRRLTFSAEGNYNPKYSRDGSQVIWLQTDGYTEGRLRAMPVGANVGKATDYAVIQRMGGYDLFSDGSMLIEQTTTYRTNYDFQDLHVWDRRTQTTQRLTFGLRAREPVISPDETHAAFIVNGESRSMLALMPLQAQAEHRVIWEGGPFAQAATPDWSPDGRYIVFSTWEAGGYRDIQIIDLETSQLERVTHDRAVEIDPVFSPDGAYVYYVSDRSGIYNVYAYDRQAKKTYQVTNVLGAALRPDVSSDGERLIYSGFGVGGFDLYEIDLDPARWTEPVPYVNDRPDPAVVPENDVAMARPRPYRPLETLAPQSYTLQLVQTSFGRAINVQTGGSDVAGWHGYTLGATLGLDRTNVNVAASYRYDRLWPFMQVAAARDSSLRSGVIIDGMNTRYTHETYSLTASLGLPLLRTPEGSGEFSVDYDLDWLINAEDELGSPDPNDTLPRYPNVDTRLAGVALRFGYSDVRSFANSMGPQKGQGLNASIRFNHPSLGSDVRSLALNYRWDTYRKLPWGLTPTLAVRLTGGIGTSSRRQPGSFALGGVPQQDVTRAIIDNLRTGATGYLRGYPSRHAVGRQFHLANLEYRQELFELERGLSTLPVYARRLHWAGLLDVGNAFDDELDLGDFNVGAGVSLRLDFVLGYFIPGTLDIGYAHGLTSGGIGEYWMLLTGTL